MRRLDRLGFQATQGAAVSLREALGRWTHAAPTATFQGKVAGIRVVLRLREGTERRARVTFSPRVTERTAVKILSRLDLDPLEGSWL